MQIKHDGVKLSPCSIIEEILSIGYLIAGIMAFESSNGFLHGLSFVLFFMAAKDCIFSIIMAFWEISKPKEEGK